MTALDLRTGRPVWSYRRSLPEGVIACCGQVNRGVAFLDDQIFVGTVDAYLVALDAKTGKLAWRFWTVPGPGEPGNETWSGDSWKRGGAPTWTTGSYDPELNLIYWGTGNPGPDFIGEVRLGDSLSAVQPPFSPLNQRL